MGRAALQAHSTYRRVDACFAAFGFVDGEQHDVTEALGARDERRVHLVRGGPVNPDQEDGLEVGVITSYPDGRATAYAIATDGTARCIRRTREQHTLVILDQPDLVVVEGMQSKPVSLQVAAAHIGRILHAATLAQA